MYSLVPQLHLIPRSTQLHRRRQTPARTFSALTAPPTSTSIKTIQESTTDASLRSTWSHRTWVIAGCTTLLNSVANTITTSISTGSFIEPIASILLGYVLADLGTGFYHWAIDNYGSSTTMIFGTQIEAFQGHHRRPSTITRREFANNLHSLARVITFVAFPLDIVAGNEAAMHAFIAAGAGFVMFSQQFHAWAHTPRRRLPPVVKALQDNGLLIATAKHSLHHRAPYNNNYCIVSGKWNWLLDKFKVFEVLEMVIFFRFGVRPRSWSEPVLEWTTEEEDDDQEQSLVCR